MHRSVLDVPKEEITQDMFENKRSYEYFMKAYFNMRDMQIIKNQGGILIQGASSIDEDFIFSTNEHGKFPMLGTGKIGKNGMTIWIGATMGLKPDTTFVYKKELSVLDGITYVEAEHVKKFDIFY